MINCIIIDDEKHARIELIYHLNKFKKLSVIADFSNEIDAINFIKKNTVDLVFLDITMITSNGIDTAQKIKSLDLNKIPYIVFVTAYDEYAARAFDLEAIDYILKPINEKRFDKCINKVLHIFEKNNLKKDYFNTTNNKDIISLSKNNIVYPIKKNLIKLVYIENRTLIIETTKGKFIVTTSLNEFEENLSSNIFFRVHRSFLININYIEEIIPWFNSTYKIKITDIDMEIPISRNQTHNFKKIMNII
ncbi:MAG: LytTR family DNA-binding domain-containing protein [Bacillota bacterium]|nr:LytTR family DNA-binding domain-containing protein [Bacillota bacterium]